MCLAKPAENTVHFSFVAFQNGDHLGLGFNRRINWLVVVYLFKTCAKFVKVIDAMLDANFQSKIGAVDLRSVSTNYKTVAANILIQEF
jgi:hypothetical protein